MSTVDFNVNFDPDLIGSADIPVEIRNPNFALVKRTLSSQSVDLAPGQYELLARLPGGQEMSATLHLADTPQTVQLSPEIEDGAPDALALQHFLGAKDAFPTSSGDDPLVPLGATDAPVRLRWFGGNLLADDVHWGDKTEAFAPEPGRAEGASAEPINKFPTYVQLLQSRRPPTNFAVPVSPQADCQMVFSKEGDRWVLSFHLRSMEASVLLQYAEKGYLQEASALSSDAVDAERILGQKGSDALAASVGAYALLRFGELERLHDWTANLMNFFPWLPDGIAIRAEHLAKIGRHDEALELFNSLPQRGLPLFSDGLAYCVDRLRYYVSVGPDQLPSDQVESAARVLKQLDPFCKNTDFRLPTLTFTGLDPTHPTNGMLGDDLFVV